MDFNTWIESPEVQEDLDAIDFVYHSQVCILLEKAFEAGEENCDEYWNP
jgi:protein tyrosine phosphatase